MEKRNIRIGTISLIVTILILISAFIFINSNLIPTSTIAFDSEEIPWIHYLIKFYVVFSVIGLTVNMILMHIKLTKFKGFHEG